MAHIHGDDVCCAVFKGLVATCADPLLAVDVICDGSHKIAVRTETTIRLGIDVGENKAAVTRSDAIRKISVGEPDFTQEVFHYCKR